ncbi:hypothetical protein PENSPDRAFT_659712 [Peniophora sp. CONT]|nr:hypothetical protein PENSPDRAFT_659712 [Peniophora sp. CONT]
MTDTKEAHVDGLSISSSDTLPPFIFILPLELLSLIVEAVAECEPPRCPVSNLERERVDRKRIVRTLWDPVSAVQGGSLGWLRLAHVCRSWRHHICEDMPLLWAQHIGCFSHSGAIEEMLRRAGEGIPLSVQSRPEAHDPERTCPPWSLVDSSVPSWSHSRFTSFKARIQSVHVIDFWNTGGENRDSLASILNDLPELRSLEVYYLHLYNDLKHLNEDELAKAGAPVILAPHLRTVRFANCFIPWTTPGVTHLSIALDYAEIPGNVFVDMLGLIAPNIEALEFDSAVPFRYFEQAHPVYAFPKLRYFYLREQDTCAEGFLRVFQDTSLSGLYLSLIPSARHRWKEFFGPAIKNALILLRHESSRPFRSVSTTLASIVDGASGLLREYVQLEFYREVTTVRSGRTTDFDLAIATENPRHIRKDYGSCFTSTQDSVAAVFPTIWGDIEAVDLDLPLWKYCDEMGALLSRLSNLRELRVVDMFEHLDHELVRDIQFPTAVFGNPHIHLDILCIVQTAKWDPELAKIWCNILTTGMKHALASSVTVDVEDRRTVREQPCLGLLRLDFVGNSDAMQHLSACGDEIVGIVKGTAERVELRFL